jgi:predicted acylesterase/phospholipase RssA
MKTAINAVGGGSKGIVTCGALKRIAEIGYKYDALYGTSSGAVNILLFAQGDIDLLEYLWLNITNSDVRSGFSLQNVLCKKSFYDNSPLLKTILKYCDPRKITVPTTVTATDTTRDLPYHFRLDRMNALFAARAVWASMAVPILFPMVSVFENENPIYYDGGCTDDYDLKVALDDGADKVVIIHPSRPNPAKISSLLDAIEWTLTAGTWSQYVHQLEGLGNMPNPPKVIPIISGQPLVLPLVDFSYKGQDRKALIQLGYDLAKEALG